MESKTLASPPSADRTGPADGRDMAGGAHGLKPTPDPTRTGALWVGGAGVALLLASAAVLTAVRWDEIGQSAKLGGLAVITLAMLWAGHRLRNTIPMTAQAVFHLGALLIPFDMAALSTLAGQTWQQTLLATALTSVLAWYGIERFVPSRVLFVSAHLGVIATAAGVAAVTAIDMPVLLAGAAFVAMLCGRVEPAALWAGVAGFLPIASLGAWPSRIAGAMADLGFASGDPWQPLAAGTLAMLTLVGLTTIVARAELAWSAVLVGAITVLLALNAFADAHVSYLGVAALFVALELLALITKGDLLWRPVLHQTAQLGEVAIGMATGVMAIYSLIPFGPGFGTLHSTIGFAAGLCALGWLTADLRRLEGTNDPLLSLVVGSDWLPTTILFPASVFAMVLAFHVPFGISALVMIGLAYWMVSTWRQGALYGAHVLATAALLFGNQTGHWTEAAIAALMALVLVLASRLRLKAHDPAGAAVGAFGAAMVWLFGTGTLVFSTGSRWPLVLAVVGVWVTSMLIDERRGELRTALSDWVGRSAAMAIVGLSVWTIEPATGLVLCVTIAALASIDYLRFQLRGVLPDHTLPAALTAVVGAALGFAAVPVSVLFDVPTATAGVALACASIVAVGMAVTVSIRAGIALGAAAAILATTGLLMASITESTFALAIMAVGAAAMLFGAAVRDSYFASAGYVAIAAGFGLQLAVWNVEWIEPYLALPALGAVTLGYYYHRSGGSSWVAYAPIIGVLSYVSLVQRFAGGPAWHSVIAGTIGVLAVLAGGYRRLAGPLVAGSVVLSIVAVHESLSSAGLVPTWAWLALGGTVLLGAGIALERSDTTPLERTQQLRHVIATQFS